MAGQMAIQGAQPLRYNGYKVPLMRNLVKRAIRGVEAYDMGIVEWARESVGPGCSDPCRVVSAVGFGDRGLGVS